ncbi:hypothetical protein [Uliginosibacterium gangwonense]|uniref:hypothetical protein n=1 Tax=Uliginosibacterium gangwonense TaxID=392736 RepID=UPI0012F9F1E1|nr:hypothetical protein [Uliginosibacterium gangwonense]
MLSPVTNKSSSTPISEVEIHASESGDSVPSTPRSSHGQLGGLRSLSQQSLSGSSGHRELSVGVNAERHPDATGSENTPPSRVSKANACASAAKSVMGKVSSMADVRTLLSRADDAEFVGQLRGEPEKAALLDAQTAAREIQRVLASVPASSPELIARSHALLTTLEASTSHHAVHAEQIHEEITQCGEALMSSAIPEASRQLLFGLLNRAGASIDTCAFKHAAEHTNGAQMLCLHQLTQNVSELKTMLEASELPPGLCEALVKRLDQVNAALDELKADKPLLNRGAKVLAINALLAPLPLIIPMMSKPVQRKTEAEIVALITKAMVEGIGLVRTPTTGNSLLKDRTMARYYANTVQALEFALPTFVSSLRSLNESVPFNIGLGLLSTVALFGGFMSKDITQKFNQKFRGDAHPKLAAEGVALFRSMGPLGEQETAACERMKAVLQTAADSVARDKKSLLDAKESFISGGRELSPYVSKQVTLAVDTYQRLADELNSVMEVHAEGAILDKDRKSKLALALFATSVCVGTTVLMLPDKIGVVDLGSDAAFTSALMFSLMANSNVSRKDALEEFKTFVGLSLVMLALLATNKGAKDFMEKGTNGLLIGSITMTALNLTLPGPVGHYAASGIEKLMNLKPSDMLNALHGIGDWVYQLFAGHAETAPKSSVVIEEIVEPDLEHGLGA